MMTALEQMGKSQKTKGRDRARTGTRAFRNKWERMGTHSKVMY